MYEAFGKRTLDILGAVNLLLLLSPLLMLCAVAVAIDDGLPILFRQRRVGKEGRDFRILKLRTMRSLHGSDRTEFSVGDVSRVTRVGTLLRESKLDELPQLVNVLRGDMSLVGPRPEVPQWVRSRPEAWRKVLRVRPGITDRASLAFRHEERELAASADPETHYRDTILPRKISLYEQYVDEMSLRTDLFILLNTVAGVFRRNAQSKTN